MLFGTGLPSIAMAGFYFFFARVLTQVEYGSISYSISAAMTGAAIAVVGLDRVIPSLLPKLESRALVGASCTLVLVLGVLLELPLFALFGLFTAVILLPETTYLLGQNILLGTHSYGRYFVYRSFLRILSVILAIVCFDLFGLTGLLMGYSLGLVWPIFDCLRLSRIDRSAGFATMKANSGFVLKSYSFDLTVVVSGYADKLVVGVLFGFLTLSYYAFGYQFFWLLEILPTGLLAFLVPEMAKKKNVSGPRTVALVIACAAALGGWVFLPMIVEMWFPPYTVAVSLLRILSICTVPSTIASMLIAELLASEHAGFATLANAAGSSAHIALLVVLGSLGPAGLGLAVLGAKTILVLSLLVTRQILKNRPDSGHGGDTLHDHTQSQASS